MRLSKKNIWQMLVMVFASVVCGLVSNFIAEKPLPLFRTLTKSGPPASAESFIEVDADFVRQIGMDSGSILVDARPAEVYRQGHIPGAVSLPLSRFDGLIAERMEQLRAVRLVVIYCSDWSCNDSHDLARRLRDRGCKDLLLYRGGFEDWREQGNAIAR